MNPLVETKRRIKKDIKRYEDKLNETTSKRRRIRREEDQIAFHRRTADIQGKIRGLKYALEHLSVAEEMSSRANKKGKEDNMTGGTTHDGDGDDNE